MTTENIESELVVEEISSPLSEPILNHLNMKTTGALLLTGAWGSGKTFHIKNYIFPLIENSSEFTPIIVSLYGETDKNNIAQKVLFSYFDSKGKNVNLGTGTITKNLKNLSEAVPYLKKFIDVEKLLIGTGENVFKLLPHDKLLICFDDVERMSDKINVDDFLGIINDLVENRGCKVILIANENEIKNGITYKEKTIEKTIHFIPNLGEIFDNITGGYPESSFKKYILNQKELFMETLTTKSEDSNLQQTLEKSFSNIRTLKFALEHFKIVFELLAGNDELTELLLKQLRNIWIFTLSVSVEFRKPNNISFTERKKLDSQTSTFLDIDLSTLNLAPSNTQDENLQTENEWSYSENFKIAYYNRLSESFIFYEEIYNLITAGMKINKTSLEQNLDEGFKVEDGEINPAHQIVNSFLHGYWKYTNEQFKENLIQLLKYCEEGKLEDIVSYLNAAVYLLGFNDIIGIDKEAITAKVQVGLDMKLHQVNFNHLAKSQFEMVKGNFTGEHLETLVTHIQQMVHEVEAKRGVEEIKNVQSLFETDLSAFVKKFLPQDFSFRTPDKPLFHNIEKDCVKQGIKQASPEAIMDLSSLMKTRYLDTSFNQYLTEEIEFINNVEEGISEIDFSNKTLSNHLIDTQLIPRIDEVKGVLQTLIARKNNL